MKFDFSEKVAETLISNGAIITEDKEFYIFGLRQGLLMLLNIAVTVTIGFLLRSIPQSIFFLMAYIPIRTYAGGYHAKTPLRCSLLSVVIMTAVLLGIKLLEWNGFICFWITLIAVGTIYFLTPVGDSNKPLNPKETIVYKKRTMIILGFLIIASILFWVIGVKQISICITMALAVLSVMLVLGYVKDRRQR